MNCRNVEARPEVLEDYAGGASSLAEVERFELHLLECADCREAVATAREAGPLLRAAYEPSGEASRAFWTRLRAQLREEENQLAAGGDFWSAVERLAWRLSFGAAALVVLLVGIVIGTQLPPQEVPERAGVQTETRDIFPEPVRPAVDGNDVLLEMAAGRSRKGR